MGPLPPRAAWGGLAQEPRGRHGQVYRPQGDSPRAQLWKKVGSVSLCDPPGTSQTCTAHIYSLAHVLTRKVSIQGGPQGGEENTEKVRRSVVWTPDFVSCRPRAGLCAKTIERGALALKLSRLRGTQTAAVWKEAGCFPSFKMISFVVMCIL